MPGVKGAGARALSWWWGRYGHICARSKCNGRGDQITAGEMAERQVRWMYLLVSDTLRLNRGLTCPELVPVALARVCASRADSR